VRFQEGFGPDRCITLRLAQGSVWGIGHPWLRAVIKYNKIGGMIDPKNEAAHRRRILIPLRMQRLAMEVRLLDRNQRICREKFRSGYVSSVMLERDHTSMTIGIFGGYKKTRPCLPGRTASSQHKYGTIVVTLVGQS
jgi:hypothetical protein